MAQIQCTGPAARQGTKLGNNGFLSAVHTTRVQGQGTVVTDRIRSMGEGNVFTPV